MIRNRWQGLYVVVAVAGLALTEPAAGFQKGVKLRGIIDIKPGDEPTTIDPKSRGMLPVALLSSRDVDATTIDAAGVRFGATGQEATAVRSMREDVNRDGKVDVMFLFRMQETGIGCGHTSASLTGTTTKGVAVEASEAFTTSGCSDNRKQ